MLLPVPLRAIRFEVSMALVVKESIFWDVSESLPTSKIFNFVKRFDCKFNPPKILRRNLYQRRYRPEDPGVSSHETEI
jgi:hypothetical protein